MKSFFSSSDSLELELVMDMLAQAGIRYEFHYDPRSQTDAQLWVQDNGDFPQQPPCSPLAGVLLAKLPDD